MPTKYDGDSCVLSYLSMLVKVFKPLLYKIDSTTSLVASAFVFFALIISVHNHTLHTATNSIAANREMVNHYTLITVGVLDRRQFVTFKYLLM